MNGPIGCFTITSLRLVEQTCPNAPFPRRAPRRYFPKSMLAISPLVFDIAELLNGDFAEDIFSMEKLL
jgi:hypothetical protein